MTQGVIFAPSFGNRPGKLIGRDDVISNFLEGLESPPGSKERAVLFLGQRGSGKTVLLLELADLARDKGFIVASPTIVSAGMQERIVEKLQDEGEKFLRMKKLKLTGGSLGAFGFSAGLQFSDTDRETKSFSYKLSKLCEALNSKGKGLLLLIDEVQANNADLKELIISYQELVGKNCNIAIALAGLPGAISSTLNDKVLTFLNRARKVELKALDITDVDLFYKQAFDAAGITLTDILRKQMAEATKGSPYMMQLVGHYVMKYAKGQRKVTEMECLAALRSAEEDFINDICRTALNTLSENDVKFLQAMAEDPEECWMADIAARMKVKADYVQIYKRRLVSAGVIEQHARGKVRFAMPYLRECLAGDLFMEEKECLMYFRSFSEAQKKRVLAYMRKLGSGDN